MSTSATSPNNLFPDACRRWRRQRKLSQLDLALAAGVSQRHVSWLETGRSSPSRAMVLRLADAMEVPLRERNLLLQSAGFAALYTEKQLDDPGMEPVLETLHHLLAHHEPCPALVVDRFWNVKMHNHAGQHLLSLAGDVDGMRDDTGAEGELNLALLSLRPEGLRRFCKNWNEVGPSFIRRLRSEAMSSGDAQLRERFEAFIALAGPLEEQDPAGGALLPVLPLALEIAGQPLHLFSVITTLGTPQDVTADELRVEAFLPGDAATEAFFRSAAES